MKEEKAGCIHKRVLPFLDLPPGFGGAMALTARGLGARRGEWFLRKEGVRIEEEEENGEKGGRKKEERGGVLLFGEER